MLGRTDPYAVVTVPSVEEGLTLSEQERVMKFLPMVKWIVARIAERLPPNVEMSDLMHTGILGLIDAVKRFSWGRENEEREFRAYVNVRVRGQVMDELRTFDMLPRSARDQVKQFQRTVAALRQELCREPDEAEVCSAMALTLDDYHRLRAKASTGAFVVDQTCEHTDVMERMLLRTLGQIDPHSPEAQLHIEEVKKVLAEAITWLSEREQQIIALYYYDELTLKEIGTIYSITESRVSQIHSQAIKKLSKRIAIAFGEAMPIAEEL